MKKLFLLSLIGIFIHSVGSFAQHVTQDITVKDAAHSKGLLIPNAFSPNNDGQNDVFEILNFSNQTLLEFKIFNRWGTVVFKTENPKKGWDGTYKNVPQPMGIYGYVIRILYPEGVEETYKGTVMLLR